MNDYHDANDPALQGFCAGLAALVLLALIAMTGVAVYGLVMR